MTAYAALVAAVNVGGRNKLAMPVLRECAEAVGGTDVVTYLQSGNVVLRFRASASTLRRELEAVLTDRTGQDLAVLVRSAAELDAVVERNPYPELSGKQLHVVFVDGPAAALVREVDPSAFAPERFTVADREIYLGLPNGIGRAKLPSKLLGSRPASVVTTRNWNTVVALRELAAERG